ncbi:MAG: hypothetical protein DRI44_05720 [Chlamydiae bacterium]|nr:MAG: hypothetical protein DRI44_05720 [Chlamydiota bacterium]
MEKVDLVENIGRVKCPRCGNEYFSCREVRTILDYIYTGTHQEPLSDYAVKIWICEKCKKEWLLDEIASVQVKELKEPEFLRDF